MSDPTYTLLGTNLFGLGGFGTSPTIEFADIDGDGLLDAVVGSEGGTRSFYRNVGSSAAPSFSLIGTNLFGLGNQEEGNAVVALGDLDGDGDFDAMVIQHDPNDSDPVPILNAYRNTGTSGSPTFTLIGSAPFGLPFHRYVESVELADLDGDRDLDLLVTAPSGQLVYRNTGTSGSPTFSLIGTGPFGIGATGPGASTDFADFDGDGDLDLVIGDQDGNLSFYRNTGTSGSPTFTLLGSNLFGLTAGSSVTPSFFDIDGDGDLDLLVSNFDGTVSVYENGPVSSLEAPAGLALDDGSNSGSTADLLTNDATPTITGTAGAVGVVTLYAGDAVVGTATLSGAGAWTITPGASLKDGVHSLTATLASGGSTSTASAALSVTIDTVAPAGTSYTLIKVGGETRANSHTSANQRFPTVAMDQDGNSVVVWSSSGGQDGHGLGVFGQRYDSAGSAIGSEFQVNGYTSSDQGSPAVAMDEDGNFVVTWLSAGQNNGDSGVYAQRYDHNGSTVGSEFLVSTTLPTYRSRGPSIDMGEAGAFVITWNAEAQGATADGIYAQMYDGSGSAVGSDFRVNSYASSSSSKDYSDVAMDANGNFIVAWSSAQQDGDGWGIYAQRYGSDGSARGSEFRVNSRTANSQIQSAVEADQNGNFVIAWSSEGQDGSGEGIFAQRYDSDGSRLGSEFQVNTTTNGAQADVAVAMDEDGDFLITWQSNQQDGDGYGVFAQRYSSAGSAIGSEFRVNTTTTHDQDRPVVAMGANGQAVVAFQLDNGSDDDIHLQYFGPQALPLPAPDLIAATDSGSSSSDNITNDSTPTFVGTTEALSVVTLYGTDGTTVLSTATADGGGAWTLTSASLADAVHTLTVIAVDPADNTSLVSGALSVTIDTVAPSISAGPSLSGGSDTGALDNLTGDNTPRILGSASAGAIVKLYDSDGTTLLGTAVAKNSGSWSINSLTLTEGEHTLTVRAVDTAGNSSGLSAPLTITIDSVAPNAPTGLRLDEGSDTGAKDGRYTADTTPTVIGTAEANSVITLYDSDATTLLGTAVADGAGVWTMVAAPLAEGVHSITVKATDLAGNMSAASEALTITIDRVAPAGIGHQFGTVGGEVQVNSHTAGDQFAPTVAMGRDGGSVVVWESSNQDGDSNGIYAQRYDSVGSAVGTEFRVNSHTSSSQSGPAVAMSQDGDFVVTWYSYGQDGASQGIYAQRYDNAGSAVGTEFRVNSTTSSTQSDAVVAMDQDGAFVVTWTSTEQDGHWNGIIAQRYDSNGSALGGEFVVNSTTSNNQEHSAVAMNANGDFVVTWQSGEQDGDDYGVYGQRYDSSGARVGTEFQVNSHTAGYQGASTVAMDADGDFVVVWESYGQDGSKYGLYGQLYDSSGSRVGSEFRVNSHTSRDQNEAAVVMDADGNFLVTWTSSRQDGNDDGVFARRYDATGSAIGSEFLVNTTTEDDQQNPAIALAANGDIIIAWQAPDGSNSGVALQRFVLAPTPLAAPDLTAASDSGASDNDGVTNESSPTFAGTTEALSLVTLYDGGSTALGTVTADGSGAWTVTSASLVDGVHSLTVMAVDRAGNTSLVSSALTITIDTIAPSPLPEPALDPDSDTGASDTVTGDATPRFGGSAAAGTIVTLYDGGVTLLGTAVADDSGLWSITTGTLDDGTHTLTVHALDIAGNSSAASDPLIVTIDTTAPDAPTGVRLEEGSDSGVKDGRYTTDDTPTITGTAEANSVVTLYDTGGTTLLGTAVADGTGAWTITTGTLSNSDHELTAYATDQAGNSSYSTSLTVSVQTLSPLLPTTPALVTGSDTGVKDGRYTSSTTPTFTGYGQAGTLVTLYDSDGTTVLGEASVDSAGGGTNPWTITSASLGAGDHSLTARAVDLAGNSSIPSLALTITIDATPPDAPTGLLLDAGSDMGAADGRYTSDTTPAVAGSAEAFSIITLYGSDGTTRLGTAVADGNGLWTVTSGSLSESTHSLTAVAVDRAGNTSQASAALTLTIDLSAPSTPDAPLLESGSDSGAADGRYTTDTAPTVTGSAEANSTVTLYDGATAVGTAVADGDGLWTATAASLAPGDHSLTVRAVDIAGNTSAASSALVVTIDLSGDAPAGLDLADDADSLTNDTTPMITGSAEAGGTVTLYEGNAVLGTGTADAVTGAWSITAFSLGHGTHSLTATAVDLAGNSSAASAALVVTIDTVGATAAASSPITLIDAGTLGSYDAGDTLTLTFSEAVDTSTITVGNLTVSGGHGLGTGATIVPVTPVGSYATSFTLTLGTGTTLAYQDTLSLAAGDVTDRAGNDAAGTVTFTAPPVADLDGDGTPDVLDTDKDGDGGLDALEDPVSNPTGGGTGDGNGDGTADNEQRHVASLPTVASSGGTPRYATIETADGLTLSGVTNGAAPSGLPRGVKMPLGQFGFTIGGVTVGGTATVSLYVDANLGLTGYYKKNGNSWQNIAAGTSTVGNKTKITFTLTDGGVFDADGIANGVIVDPGGPTSYTPPPPVVPTGTETVDGVTVGKGTQTNSDGTTSTVVTIPVVTGTRSETVGGNTVADIPLVKTSGGASLLTAQVPTGLGLTMTGSATVKTAGSSLTDLIREIQAHTTEGSSDQTQLTGGGSGFLNGLPADTPLLVQTIVPAASEGATASAEPLVITGTPTTAGNPYTALVIDTRGLPSGTVIQLQNVEFAAVIGAVRVTGGEGSQTVWGDGEAQYIVLGADDDTLHGGGGDDHVGSHTGNDLLFGDGGADTVTGGEDDDIVYGNQQDDMVYGNQGDDTLFGGQDQDIAFGGQGDDVAYGNKGEDVVYGNKGNDLLFGGQGSDTLFGGQGDDTLFGNLGDDVLTGGAGSDLFAVQAGGGSDLVTDFRFEDGDRLFADGRSWTVSDGAAGAVIDFGSGDKVTLASVRADQVSAAWFKVG